MRRSRSVLLADRHGILGRVLPGHLARADDLGHAIHAVAGTCFLLPWYLPPEVIRPGVADGAASDGHDTRAPRRLASAAHPRGAAPRVGFRGDDAPGLRPGTCTQPVARTYTGDSNVRRGIGARRCRCRPFTEEDFHGDRRRIRQSLPAVCACRRLDLVALRAACRGSRSPSRHISTSGNAARIRTMSPPRRLPGGPVYYTAQSTGKLGILDPKSGKVEEIALGKVGAARGHRRAGRRAVVHRRRAERDRARRPVTREVKVWPLPPRHTGYTNLNTRTFDKQGAHLVCRAKRELRPARPGRRHESVESAARQRPLRHHDHARGRRLLRVARRQPHRAHRPRNRRGHGDRAADQTRARAACGPIRRAGSGSATGTPGTSACTIRRRKLARVEAAGQWPRAYSVWVDDRTRSGSPKERQRDRPLRSRRRKSSTAFRRTAGAANVRQMLGRKGEAWGAESGKTTGW